MNNRSKKIFILLLVCMVVLLVSLVAVLTHFLSNDTNSSLPQDPSSVQDDNEQNDTNNKAVDFSGFSILSTAEQDGSVVVETTFGTFRYPFAFSDIITVKAQGGDSSATLVFTAKIDSEEILLFTVHYGGKEGSPCGILTLSDDEKTVVVSVTFADPPADLSSDAQTTFWAAQEVFNDVIASMEEDPRFSGD